MHNSSSNTAPNNTIYTIEWQEINYQRGKTASPLYENFSSYAIESWLRHAALDPSLLPRYWLGFAGLLPAYAPPHANGVR